MVVRRDQYEAPIDKLINKGCCLFKVNNNAINKKLTDTVCEKVQTLPDDATHQCIVPNPNIIVDQICTLKF